MNDAMRDILLVALGGAALFAGIYIACLVAEKYQAWRRKKDDEEYEAWRAKRRKAREEREAARAKEAPRVLAGEGDAAGEQTDGEATEDLPQDVASRTRLALSYEYAGRAQRAYREGTGLVESYFYAQLAKMNGHRQITTLLSQIRVAWRQMGYPDEKAFIHDDFGALESAMGRACLRIDSRHDAALGTQSLRELAAGGVEMAGVLLAERGIAAS